MKKTNIFQNRIQLFIGGLMAFFFVVSIISCEMKPPENSLVAQIQRGKVLFNDNCVTCHGQDGTGIEVDSLATQPANLTRIKRRRGVKEFPLLEIANIIDGRKEIPGHDKRVMPKWGEELNKDGMLTDADIKGKMAELVAYLMTIQE